MASLAEPDDDPERELNAEEILALARATQDPEFRRQVSQTIQATYLNPDLWREVARSLTQIYLNPDMWRNVANSLREIYLDPELWQGLAGSLLEAISDPELWSEALAHLDEAYAPETLRELAERLAAKSEAADPEVGAAARSLSDELNASAEAEPQPSAPAVLSWWLASRPSVTQGLVFLAAMELIERVTALLERLGGEKLPTGLEEATQVAIAIAYLFLLLRQAHEEAGEE